jgi:hypothetical protein
VWWQSRRSDGGSAAKPIRGRLEPDQAWRPSRSASRRCSRPGPLDPLASLSPNSDRSRRAAARAGGRSAWTRAYQPPPLPQCSHRVGHWRNRRSVTSSRIWRWLPAEVTATARYGPTQPLRRACRSGCAWPDCGRADPNDGLRDDRLLAALEDHGWAGSRQRPSTSRSSRTRKRERGRSRVPDSVSEVRSPSRSSGDTTKWTSIPGRVILRLLLAAAEELVTGHGERRHAAISE